MFGAHGRSAKGPRTAESKITAKAERISLPLGKRDQFAPLRAEPGGARRARQWFFQPRRMNPSEFHAAEAVLLDPLQLARYVGASNRPGKPPPAEVRFTAAMEKLRLVYGPPPTLRL